MSKTIGEQISDLLPIALLVGGAYFIWQMMKGAGEGGWCWPWDPVCQGKKAGDVTADQLSTLFERFSNLFAKTKEQLAAEEAIRAERIKNEILAEFLRSGQKPYMITATPPGTAGQCWYDPVLKSQLCIAATTGKDTLAAPGKAPVIVPSGAGSVSGTRSPYAKSLGYTVATAPSGGSYVTSPSIAAWSAPSAKSTGIQVSSTGAIYSSSR